MSVDEHFCDYIGSGVWNVPRAVKKNAVIIELKQFSPSSVQITTVRNEAGFDPDYFTIQDTHYQLKPINIMPLT